MSRRDRAGPPGRLLILGGASRIGRAVAALGDPNRVICTSHRISVTGGVLFDPLHQSVAAAGMALSGVTHALVLFAMTSPDFCARHPDEARALNVTATLRVIADLWALGIVPVFASSEAVFDGGSGGYREDDTPRPVTLYGKMKREVEQVLLASVQPSLILRIARVVSSLRGDGSLLAGWLEQLVRGEEIVCAVDQCFSPIHQDDLACGIWSLISADARGLFHLAGPSGLSRFAMLRLLVERYQAVGGIPCGVTRSCSIDDFPTVEPRPKNITLDPSKFIAHTRIMPRSPAVICQEIVACPVI
jgi:dTDP-4-dehydrorhamnose reductase